MSRDLRRLMRYAISDVTLVKLFGRGNQIRLDVLEGFPDDAVIVRHYFDIGTATYYVVTQSETFDQVPEVGIIPVGMILLKSISDVATNLGGANEGQETRSHTTGSGEGLRDAGEAGGGDEKKA